MKKMIFAVLFCHSAYAITPQEGGAGTVCWSKGGEWVSTDSLYNVEEVYKPSNDEQRERVRFRDFGYDYKTKKVNLNSSKVASAAYEYLLKIWSQDEAIGAFLIDVSLTLSAIESSEEIVREKNDLNYYIKLHCSDNQVFRAIYTNSEGKVTIYPNFWVGLTMDSAKKLFIHEIIRIADTRFKIGLTEEEILELTYYTTNKSIQEIVKLSAYQKLKQFVHE